MPTLVESAAQANRTSSTELQKLLLCLGLVAAVVFTSFGIVKLIGLFATSGRTATNEVIPTRKTIVQGTAAHLPQVLTVAELWPRDPLFNAFHFPDLAGSYRKRPADLSRGAIQYTKSSPHLQHISSPGAYAMRHRRRLVRTRPGPSPLRNVIMPHSTRPTWSNPYRSRAHPGTGVRSAPRSIPVKLQAPAQIRTQNYPTGRSALTIPWPSVLHLHHIADGVVGAHPHALPLWDRRPPTGTHQHPAFPWVASSGVGVGVSAKFKFGLVRGNNAASGHPPSEASSSPRSLLKAKRAGNVACTATQGFATKGAGTVRKVELRQKENVAVC